MTNGWPLRAILLPKMVKLCLVHWTKLMILNMQDDIMGQRWLGKDEAEMYIAFDYDSLSALSPLFFSPSLLFPLSSSSPFTFKDPASHQIHEKSLRETQSAMDPVSFAFAVVGMFSTCAQGYKIFSDAYKAPSDAQKAARDVRIEGYTLEVWGEHFEIHQAKKQQSDKLKIHLLRGPTMSGCFEALCAISEIFTDIKGLDRKYGIYFKYHAKGDRVRESSPDLLQSLTKHRVLTSLGMFALC